MEGKTKPILRKDRKGDVYEDIKWNGWGTHPTSMQTTKQDPLVARHPKGYLLKNWIPFVQRNVNGETAEPCPPLKLTPGVTKEEAISRLSKPVINDAFVAGIRKTFDENKFKEDSMARLCHIFGKNTRDLIRSRYGWMQRAPDAIFLPENHDDCVKFMELAHEHNVVIIPFGGGTNVTGCVEPSPFETRRMVVSVDMRRMSRLLKVDTDSKTATFEVGVLGPDVEDQLRPHGHQLGHDPDSFLHSTLGGWIGARSSGAMSNKYGDIEQMVLSLKIATPTGVVETPTTSKVVGIDLNGIFVGSEGIFGIITEATVKIEPIPPVKHYEGFLFPTFESGLAAFQEVYTSGVHPTCMRLHDGDETALILSMQHDPPFLKGLLMGASMAYLGTVRGFKPFFMSICILGFEGRAEQVESDKNITHGIFAKHGGFNMGTSVGNGWQEKKYDLPYTRDHLLDNGMWAEVTETSVLFKEAVASWKDTKKSVHDVWKKHGRRGMIGCHAAHQYKMGCCLYYTFASQQINDQDLTVSMEIKKASVEAFLRNNGNLTHHHGIGYDHVPWFNKYFKPGSRRVMYMLKREFDPKGICNPGKFLPEAPLPNETEEQTEARQKKRYLFDKMMSMSHGSKL